MKRNHLFWNELNHQFPMLTKAIKRHLSFLPLKLIKKKKVLIIDDLFEYTEILSRVLSKKFKVETAINLREARQKYSVFLPDLLIVDLHLPDGLGTEIIREIREKKGEDPFIFLHTAQWIKDGEGFKRKNGIDEIMTKPMVSSEILRLCQSWLN